MIEFVVHIHSDDRAVIRRALEELAGDLEQPDMPLHRNESGGLWDTAGNPVGTFGLEESR